VRSKLFKRHRSLRATATAVSHDSRGTSVKTPAKKLTLKR
jgi:hypothetical protein